MTRPPMVARSYPPPLQALSWARRSRAKATYVFALYLATWAASFRIIEGDPKVLIDGVRVAFDGHLTSCGARLITTVPKSNRGQ